eukprot:4320949-Prymnesium_polylepis.1
MPDDGKHPYIYPAHSHSCCPCARRRPTVWRSTASTGSPTSSTSSRQPAARCRAQPAAARSSTRPSLRRAW